MFGFKLSIPKFMLILTAVLSTMLNQAPALANGPDPLARQVEELSRIVKQQQQILKKQAAELERLRQRVGAMQAAPAAPVKGAALAAAPPPAKSSWANRFKFSTDLRLRWENFTGRKVDGEDLADRNRFRIRWRLYSDVTLTDELSLHGMLTTSSGKWFEDGGRNWQPGRTSNVTMGEEMNNKNVFIGRIYATYIPKWAPGLELVGGKFKNTFLHTDIMWDPDVNPEGFYQRYQYNGFKRFKPFVHLGQMVVAENNRDSDAWLFLWQAGAIIEPIDGFKWTLAGSYYNWVSLDKSDMSQVDGNAAGNTVTEDDQYAFEYRLVQGITTLEFKLASIPVMLWLDYINNVADGVPSGHDTAWSTGFMLGRAKKKGDLALYFKYARIESDAVVGAIADGDFYGSNRQGYKVQVRYQIVDPLQFRVSWFQTDVIDGTENKENRLQMDMIFKF